jgi:hypothetical protein
MKRRLLSGLALLVLSATSPGALARPPEPPSAAVPAPPASVVPVAPAPRAAQLFIGLSVLHATHGKPELDPRVSELVELTRPPFSKYERYRLLGRARLPLERGVPRTHRLPNRRVLRAELKQRVALDGARFVASINQPGGADFLPLLEVTARLGQRFIVAGQSYRGGILVLVVSLEA